MKARSGHLHKRGGIWHVRWIVDGKVFTRTTGTGNRREAEQKRVEIMRPFASQNEVEILRGIQSQIEGRTAELRAWDDEQHPPLPFASAWRAYDESASRPDSGERTLAGYKAIWMRFAEWMGEQHPEIAALRDVSVVHADDYAKHLTRAGVSASTFNQHIGLLRLLWRVLEGEIKGDGKNPWAGIRRKNLSKLAHRKRALTPAQLESILAAAEADPDLRDLLTLLAWTGQRLVDGVKLRWESVDFSRQVISLYPAKTARRTGKAVHVPIFPALNSMLEGRAATYATEPKGHIFPALVEAYDRDAGSTLAKRIREVFAKVVTTTEKRDGLARGVCLYGAHSLRHFYVTQATAAGMPPGMLKAITGHTGDAMLDHYSQLSPEIVSDFTKRLGNGAKALPAPALVEAAAVVRLAEKLTAKTAKRIRAELLELAGVSP